VIIRGETSHADLIGTAVTQALMQISVRHRLPVIHEVLLVANRAQADTRCLDPQFSRGSEAAHAALAMVRLMSRLGKEQGGSRRR
jgi:6,7-dimethyl-8-ribityllumazine synthase